PARLGTGAGRGDRCPSFTSGGLQRGARKRRLRRTGEHDAVDLRGDRRFHDVSGRSPRPLDSRFQNAGSLADHAAGYVLSRLWIGIFADMRILSKLSFKGVRSGVGEAVGKRGRRVISLLDDQLDATARGTRLAIAMSEGKTSRPEARREIASIEHEGDASRKKLVGILIGTFITPIDREDLYRLSRSVDRSEEQRLNSSHVSSSYAVFCWKKK